MPPSPPEMPTGAAPADTGLSLPIKTIEPLGEPPVPPAGDPLTGPPMHMGGWLPDNPALATPVDVPWIAKPPVVQVDHEASVICKVEPQLDQMAYKVVAMTGFKPVTTSVMISKKDLDDSPDKEAHLEWVAQNMAHNLTEALVAELTAYLLEAFKD